MERRSWSCFEYVDKECNDYEVHITYEVVLSSRKA
jgi:hypothetical protein